MPDTPADKPDPLVPASLTETVEVLAGQADRGLLLLCDHASNHLPEAYGTLGVPAGDLGRHIAYDIGAAEVTRRMAEALGVPAVLTRSSRLLIDPNRGLDDPTLIMRLADGAIVPGNRCLSPEERELRIRRYYTPYHDTIGRLIRHCSAAGAPPALISIHSFTETWKGVPRPWHAGILWDADDRLARPLLDGLRADKALVVGDNEPYSGRLPGDTMWRHGTQRGLAHALVEIRQDLIRDAAGQAAWAERLVGIARACVGSAIGLVGPEMLATAR